MNAIWTVIHSKEQLEKLTKTGKVMVGFGASWCHGSQQLEQTLRSSIGEMSDVTVAWVDATQVKDAGQRYAVFSVPALITFNEGIPVEHRTGNLSKEVVTQLFQQNKLSDWEEWQGMEYLC